jgi:phosphate transport system substrate-binding protein
MRRLCFVVFLGLTSLVAVGCSRSTIKIDGSSTVIRITEAVTEEFRGEHPQVRVIGGKSGTGGGFKKFAHGEIDICDASRVISELEREACAKNGIEFVELEIAFDGISLVAHPQNDWCECLTVEQLKAIWEPQSKIKNWSDINPAWPQQEIELYGPGTDSGTFDYFTEAIIGKSGRSRQDYSASEDDNVLVMGVEGDNFSLGYFGMAYYEENRDRMKLLAVDSGDGQCIKPSEETVRNGTYKPLSRPLYIYVRKSSLERPEVRAYVEFYLQRVNDLVGTVGYVPVTDEIIEKSKQRLNEAIDSLPKT